jgi:hypothetical protein
MVPPAKSLVHKPSSPARFAAPFAEIRKRYGKASGPICDAIEALGKHVDVSGLSQEKLREKLWKLPDETLCLVGGYALIPPFVRDNPTGPRTKNFAHCGDPDRHLPTDAPYGADPKDPAGELVPKKAISRIPDGAPPDAPSFLKTLEWQAQALTSPTRAGSFELASDDLATPARAISQELKKSGGSGKVSLSPKDRDIGDPDLTAQLSSHGRVHLLLHGSDKEPQWSALYGRVPHAPQSEDTRALSAPLLDLCDLRGAFVAMTSCYGAMLDGGDHAPSKAARAPANQPALAMLAHGAKAIFGATRSNWIDLKGDQSFGPALTAHLWTRLGQGLPAAAALRRAKQDLHDELIHGDASDLAFGIKTLLQAHCFGHPLAQLLPEGK